MLWGPAPGCRCAGSLCRPPARPPAPSASAPVQERETGQSQDKAKTTSVRTRGWTDCSRVEPELTSRTNLVPQLVDLRLHRRDLSPADRPGPCVTRDSNSTYYPSCFVWAGVLTLSSGGHTAANQLVVGHRRLPPSPQLPDLLPQEPHRLVLRRPPHLQLSHVARHRRQPSEPCPRHHGRPAAPPIPPAPADPTDPQSLPRQHPAPHGLHPPRSFEALRVPGDPFAGDRPTGVLLDPPGWPGPHSRAGHTQQRAGEDPSR